MPVPKRAAAEAVSFGSIANYVSGGLSIPEGDYALDFTIKMFTPTKKDGSQSADPFLAVVLSASPLSGGDAIEGVYSLGRKAHLSFAPNPDTGKGLVPAAGGAGQPLSRGTNFFLLLESLYNSGLPEGVFDNDLSVLDGIHVHMHPTPEPAERAEFRASTGESALGADGKPKGPRMIALVTEIKDDGRPWEGTGGAPGEKTAKKAVAKAVAAPKAGPRPVAVPQEEEVDLLTAANAAITDYFTANENGGTKVGLRTATFKFVSENQDADTANAVIKTYFSNDDALNGLIGDAGYVVSGLKVVPA
jgi:hypothetical protein